MSSKKILYVRSAPYELSFNSYNLQEVGLGKAFCRRGYDFDIVYYTKGKNRDQVVETPQNQLRIFWRRGIRILRSGLYPEFLKEETLNQYDAVIMSEYGQTMSVAVANKFNNVYLYNGPYYNLFKIPFVEPFYDALFCSSLQKNMKKVFNKTRMAESFLAQKGITNSCVVGVGLDSEKFDAENEPEEDTQKLLNQMEGHRNLLFVGSIIKRKNVEVLVQAFSKLKTRKENKDVQLVLVGKGDAAYEKKCRSLIPEEYQKDVIWCSFIKNAQMKFVYQKADIFLLPSIQEIFGMVLLEAMYFSRPVVSSCSAGADTLIKNGVNGLIADAKDAAAWEKAISGLLDDPADAARIGVEAGRTVRDQFTWDKIAEKMINEMTFD